MGLKRIDVRVPDSTLSAIKKRGFAEGKSTSAIVRDWIESMLDNSSGSESGLGPGTDQVEAFKKAIRELRQEGEDEEDYRIALADLGLESLKTSSGSSTGHSFSPEVIRYLVGTQARIDSLLRNVLIHTEMPGITPGEREDWIGVATRKEEEVLKNLNLGGEKGGTK